MIIPCGRLYFLGTGASLTAKTALTVRAANRQPLGLTIAPGRGGGSKTSRSNTFGSSGMTVSPCAHVRGVHPYNYSDLPLFDILFGTFRNPKEFAAESGFYDGASAKVPQLLVFKDGADSDFDPAMRPARN